jgi:hypothetical protein
MGRRRGHRKRNGRLPPLPREVLLDGAWAIVTAALIAIVVVTLRDTPQALRATVLLVAGASLLRALSYVRGQTVRRLGRYMREVLEYVAYLVAKHLRQEPIVEGHSRRRGRNGVHHRARRRREDSIPLGAAGAGRPVK